MQFSPKDLSAWVKATSLLHNLTKATELESAGCVFIGSQDNWVKLAGYRTDLGLLTIELPIEVLDSSGSKEGIISGDALNSMTKPTKGIIKNKGSLVIELAEDCISYTSTGESISLGRLTESLYSGKPNLPIINDGEEVIRRGEGLKKLISQIPMDSNSEWPHLAVGEGMAYILSDFKGSSARIGQEVNTARELKCQLKQSQIKLLKEFPNTMALRLTEHKAIGSLLHFMAWKEEEGQELGRYSFYCPMLEDDCEDAIGFILGGEALSEFLADSESIREAVEWQSYGGLLEVSLAWSTSVLEVRGKDTAKVAVNGQSEVKQAGVYIAPTLVAALKQMKGEVRVKLYGLNLGELLYRALIIEGGNQIMSVLEREQ